jgi:hypothetical protein
MEYISCRRVLFGELDETAEMFVSNLTTGKERQATRESGRLPLLFLE